MASAHTAQSLIQQISDYGTCRGEPTASEWLPTINRINGYLLAHPDQTHTVTTKLLNTLHRVQRGENVFPVSYKSRSTFWLQTRAKRLLIVQHELKAGDTMPTNHDFELKRYTTASQSVARAVRDVSTKSVFFAPTLSTLMHLHHKATYSSQSFPTE